MDEIEEFKDIPGYEGIYQISNLGRVKSLKRKGNLNEKILKPRKDRYGYARVILCKNNNKKFFKIHQLVAVAFLGHKPDGSMKVVINHKDENKLNNNVENLEICSQRFNTIYSSKNKFGFVGINKTTYGKYQARIVINKKRINLGTFKTPEDANQAYQNAYNKIEKN